MHRLLLVFLLFISGPLRAEVPPLLEDALENMARDLDRWAYTETIMEKNDKGESRKNTVVRFDPSRPYAEQYRPITVGGRPPSESDLKKYRKRGEKRGGRNERAEREGTTHERKTLGELMDLGRATVIGETDQSVTYEVPLMKKGNTRFPPEKFLVTARVGKELRAFESIAVKLRAPLREKLIVKVSEGEGAIDFAVIDPKFSPALAVIRGTGSGSILFVPVGRSYELTRGEFKRVKPYAERFDVQIGPLQAIDF